MSTRRYPLPFGTPLTRLWRAAAVLPVLFWSASPCAASGTPLQQEGAIEIISPANGTVVAPNTVIPVYVRISSSSVPFLALGILAENIGMGPAAITYVPSPTPPVVFSLPIPNNVIGNKKVTAFAITSPGEGVFSDPVTIDIEARDVATTHLIPSPAVMHFEYTGQQFPLDATANFADGPLLDVTESTRTTYQSSDTSIATVTAGGLVTAVGAGNTTVTVRCDSQSVKVPVSVPQAMEGDLNGDGRVDEDDENVILSFLNTPATGSFDARDLNHDGVIDEKDSAALRALCSKPDCTDDE